MAKKKDITLEEIVGLEMIRSKLPEASDEFLKKAYLMVKKELKDRGVLKSKNK